MMKKRFFFSAVIFAVSFLWLGSGAVTVLGEAPKNRKNQKKPEAILAYYDVEKGTETLITKEDIQQQEKQHRNFLESNLEPDYPALKPSLKQLTESEKEKLKEADMNTLLHGTGEIQTVPSFNAIAAIYNRTLIPNPNAYPYYSVAKLYLFARDGSRHSGTGFAVGSNLCATSRHFITDKNGNFMKSITAYFGYDGAANSYTYKTSKAAGYIYDPRYKHDGNGTDIAFIIWANTATISHTGNFGISKEIPVSPLIGTMGYPKDFYSELKMTESYDSIFNHSVRHLYSANISEARMQSGAPVFVMKSEGPYAIGILTDRNYPGTKPLMGRRFDALIIKWLCFNGYIQKFS